MTNSVDHRKVIAARWVGPLSRNCKCVLGDSDKYITHYFVTGNSADVILIIWKNLQEQEKFISLTDKGL